MPIDPQSLLAFLGSSQGMSVPADQWNAARDYAAQMQNMSGTVRPYGIDNGTGNPGWLGNQPLPGTPGGSYDPAQLSIGMNQLMAGSGGGGYGFGQAVPRSPSPLGMMGGMGGSVPVSLGGGVRENAMVNPGTLSSLITAGRGTTAPMWHESNAGNDYGYMPQTNQQASSPMPSDPHGLMSWLQARPELVGATGPQLDAYFQQIKGTDYNTALQQAQQNLTASIKNQQDQQALTGGQITQESDIAKQYGAEPGAILPTLAYRNLTRDEKTQQLREAQPGEPVWAQNALSFYDEPKFVAGQNGMPGTTTPGRMVQITPQDAHSIQFLANQRLQGQGAGQQWQMPIGSAMSQGSPSQFGPFQMPQTPAAIQALRAEQASLAAQAGAPAQAPQSDSAPAYSNAQAQPSDTAGAAASFRSGLGGHLADAIIGGANWESNAAAKIANLVSGGINNVAGFTGYSNRDIAGQSAPGTMAQILNPFDRNPMNPLMAGQNSAQPDQTSQLLQFLSSLNQGNSDQRFGVQGRPGLGNFRGW